MLVVGFYSGFGMFELFCAPLTPLSLPGPFNPCNKQGLVDKLHVCLVSNLCSQVGVFASLWADTSIPKRDGRCWNMLHVCELFPCQSFWLIALCCLWACALMYNRTGNACRVCGRAPRNDVFLFMREMKSAEGKGEIKGRGWIQEHECGVL